MLTDAQVEKATGFAVTSREPGVGQGFATVACRWVLDTKTGPQGIDGFSVSVKSPGGRSRFDILAGGMPAVPGLGDAAYRQGDSIWAVTGDALVILEFGFLSSAYSDAGSALVPLVEIVLAQL